MEKLTAILSFVLISSTALASLSNKIILKTTSNQDVEVTFDQVKAVYEAHIGNRLLKMQKIFENSDGTITIAKPFVIYKGEQLPIRYVNYNYNDSKISYNKVICEIYGLKNLAGAEVYGNAPRVATIETTTDERYGNRRGSVFNVMENELHYESITCVP